MFSVNSQSSNNQKYTAYYNHVRTLIPQARAAHAIPFPSIPLIPVLKTGRAHRISSKRLKLTTHRTYLQTEMQQRLQKMQEIALLSPEKQTQMLTSEFPNASQEAIEAELQNMRKFVALNRQDQEKIMAAILSKGYIEQQRKAIRRLAVHNPLIRGKALERFYERFGKIHPIHAHFHRHEITSLYDDCSNYFKIHDAFFETVLHLIDSNLASVIRQNAAIRQENFAHIQQLAARKLQVHFVVDISTGHAEAFFLAKTTTHPSATAFCAAVENLKSYFTSKASEPQQFSALLAKLSTTWQIYDDELMKHHSTIIQHIASLAKIWLQ